MKMEGWAERIGVGAVGFVFGVVVMVGLALILQFWWWPLLSIPLVFAILAMIYGDEFLKSFKNFDGDIFPWL